MNILRVLGYQEDNEWVAVCLEMDISGHGGTSEEALEDLKDLVRIQIEFALDKQKPELIWRNAEPQFFEMFDEARRGMIRAKFQKKAYERPLRAGAIEFPMVFNHTEASYAC